MPFISYLLTIGKGDFSKEDLTHGNGLYSQGSQISFLEWCNFDPNPDDENKCKPPTKLKGQRVVTLWNPLLWKEYGITGKEEVPVS